MKMDFDVKGARRKELVSAIATILNAKVKYLGMPTMAYSIGDATVDKDGVLEMEIITKDFLEELEEMGFVGTEENVDGLGLCVSMPLEGFTEESIKNLRRIIESKATLIQKALMADRLDVEVKDGKVTFPWWDTLPNGEQAQAYTAFITAVSKMAKQAKRVTAHERDVPSEKYTFRCFLLRLGFIGTENKNMRKILLRNLDGPAAFPSVEKAEAFRAKTQELHNGDEETQKI